VVCFDTIPEESYPLKSELDIFRVTFNEPGIFTYKCSIYTRMKGKVEVIGSVPLVK
jgi:plastocyanin